MANNSINSVMPVNFINTSDTNYAWLTPKPLLDAKGGKIEIIIDGVSHLTDIDKDGNWKFTPPGGWAEGMHTVQLVTIDRATNRSAPTTYIVNVDKTPPSQPEIWRAVDNTGSDKGNLTPGDTSDERKPVLSGVAEPQSIVYLYDNTGTTPIGSAKADNMGAWTITPTLDDGSHSLTVTSQDITKNTSVKSAPFVLKIAAGAVVFAEQGDSETPAPVEDNKSLNLGTFAQDSSAIEPIYLDRRVINGSGTNLKEAGSTIYYIINREIYSGKVQADGKWSVQLPELDDGTYFFQTRFLDRAGNWGAVTQRIIIIDADALAPPQIMRVIDDVGTVDYLTSSQFTNDNTPTLSGVAQPGSLVSIYGTDSTIIGSVKASDDGRWSFTPTLNADGTHVFNVAYTDRHGKTSPKSDNFTLNLDTSIPSTPTLNEVYDDEGRSTGALKSGDTTDDKTPTLSGKGDAGSIVRIWDGSTLIGSVVVDKQGEWKLDLDLDEGTYNLRVDAISKGGNTSPGQTENFRLIIDTNILPPVEIEEVVANNGPVEIPLHDGDSTNDTTPVLRGTGNDGDIVYVREDGKDIGSATVVGGKWEVEVPALEEGPHELVVQIGDAAGDKRSGDSAPINLIIDTKAPGKPDEPAIIDNEGDKQGPVGPGEAIDDSRPEFTGGDADKGDTVKIIIRDEKGDETVIGTAIVGDNGDWSIRPTDPIPDGEYEVIVEITDPAGNTSQPSDPVDLIIDTKVPDALKDFELIDDIGPKKGPIHNGDFTDDTKPTISGTGVDGTKVIIYDGARVIGSATVANGKWELELPTLSEGKHDIKVQPVSASGVKGPISDGINFDVDTTAPTTGTFDSVKTDKANDGTEANASAAENDNTLIMYGTGTSGDVVTLYGNAAHTLVIGSTTVVNGTWRFETPELPDAVYQFSAGFSDAAGNEYRPATKFDIEVDTQAPLPPEIELFGMMDLNEGLMNMSLNDIMSQSSDSLFIDNGKTQMIVSEKGSQELKLEDILPKGEDVSNWTQANGTVTVAGVEYNVYQNNGGDAEVMVPQHLIQEQH
ncbi:Ig-like domain-containing protein [Pantoea sp.]|uniref:Ig-like domain-containing protein n=1 Tax=Pantoea sp. TaxID=69393 RepID=UPI0031CF8A34